MTTCRLLVRLSARKPRLIHRVGVLALGMSLLSALVEAQVTYTPDAFTTLAGKASIGSADGPGEAARFSSPFDVAVDAAGNLYVADTNNHTIRKITPAGVVTTLAGLAGVSGSTDGAGSAARFYHPEGITVDLFGNVYVADTYNDTIRKITSGGLVTTLAGVAGYYGNTNGTGSAALFDYPSGVAVDGAGNVYATETYNYYVRKITPTGTVTTLAGSPDDAVFMGPGGVAVDAGGNIFVADTYNDRICKITPAGMVTTLRMADGTAAYFYRPQKLGLDAVGNVYVSDSLNHRILRLTTAGDLTIIATLPADLPQDPTSVPYADGVAVDAWGNVYVADTGNSAVRKITQSGVMTTVAGFGPGFGSTDGVGSVARFFYPAGVAADGAGNVYAADMANHTIRKIAPGGIVTTLAGLARSSGDADGTGSAARFNSPSAVAVDAVGNVYVADTGNGTIRKLTPAGVVSTLAGLAGSSGNIDATGSAARFSLPQSLAADAAGNVYVADIHQPLQNFLRWSYYSEIRKITAGGEVTTLATLSEVPGLVPPPPAALSLAIDRAGNLLAADFYTSVIWRISVDGTASIFAGTPTVYGGDSVDGTGAAARFTALSGIAVDAAGSVYVADCHAIRRIAPGGVVTTLAGVSELFGSADGTGSAARFNAPSGIAVDNAGRLYVADTDNQTIRMGVAASTPVILTQPQSQAVSVGANVQFSVTASGSPEPTLQWFRNGSAISGATGSTLTLAGVLSSDAGDYTVTASNDLGSVTSNKATLTIRAAAAASSSSGGGGGAMEAWFVVGLVMLGTARIMTRPHETA
jgi:sugar lactone lactonase YvrE